MKIDMTQASTYKINPNATRTGVLKLLPAEYQTAWGIQILEGPHLRLNEPDTKTAEQYPYYGCALKEFVETYTDTTKVGVYIKKAQVKAKQLDAETTVDTLEGPMQAAAGAWVLQDGTGNQWPVSDATFRKTYVLFRKGGDRL